MFGICFLTFKGEKQRLSFMRILYHKPKYALLDEFTSSVDQEMETVMYECLNNMKCTYMSIAHRDTVKKYHHIEMRILKDSTYEVINLDLNSNLNSTTTF